jgi:peptide deformylase
VSAREVLLYPDPRLKQVAVPAQPDEVEEVSTDLLDTMDSLGHCVGLAAPQLGAAVRIVCVDLTGHRRAPDNHGRLLLVNPRIIAAEGAEIGREGCLSIPDLTADVRRATRISVEHAGGALESVGFEARCIQHEIDHLDGVLFLDRVASLVDDVFRRKRYAEGPGGSEGGR